jgi:hypothetical protein
MCEGPGYASEGVTGEWFSGFEGGLSDEWMG